MSKVHLGFENIIFRSESISWDLTIRSSCLVACSVLVYVFESRFRCLCDYVYVCVVYVCLSVVMYSACVVAWCMPER